MNHTVQNKLSEKISQIKVENKNIMILNSYFGKLNLEALPFEDKTINVYFNSHLPDGGVFMHVNYKTGVITTGNDAQKMKDADLSQFSNHGVVSSLVLEKMEIEIHERLDRIIKNNS